MSNRTYCDVCGIEIEAVSGNVTREGGRINGDVVLEGHRVAYELTISLDGSWDCCRACGLRALMTGEGVTEFAASVSEGNS